MSDGSVFSSIGKLRSGKISKTCATSRSPFRKTQTEIRKHIETNEPLNHTWEDIMDKNFELIAKGVEKKQKAKDENIQKRYYLTETLDEMDACVREKDDILRDTDKLKTHNLILGTHILSFCRNSHVFDFIEEECSKIQNEIKRVLYQAKKIKNAKDKEMKKVKDIKVKIQYSVDKSQRELEESREKWNQIIDDQVHNEICVAQDNLEEAESEISDLQHHSRNTHIRLENESKRLKEKMLAINMMINNQDSIPTSNGKVIVKQVSNHSSLSDFYDKMRKIVNK